MGRGVQKEALANSGTANQLSSQYNSNAQSAFDVLNPTLKQQALNPQGFTPNDLTAMRTSSLQSLGGSQAGAAGAGALRAARTRNAGAGDAAIGESAREAMRRNSQNAVTIDANNAIQREKNRQAGLTGLENLFGTSQGGALQALGLSNQSLGVASGAKNGFFDQFGNSFANSLGQTLGKAPGIV